MIRPGEPIELDDEEPEDIAGDGDWNPLAPPSRLVAYDVVPGTWTPEHLERRFVEAFAILRMIKMRGHSLGFGSAWPAYQHTWADRVHQQDLTEAEKRDRAKEKNRTRLVATADQVELVEFVHGELWRIIGRLPDHACFVVAYCDAMAAPPWRQREEGDVWKIFDDACRRRGIGLSAGITVKIRVFRWLAGTLNREKKPVL